MPSLVMLTGASKISSYLGLIQLNYQRSMLIMAVLVSSYKSRFLPGGISADMRDMPVNVTRCRHSQLVAAHFLTLSHKHVDQAVCCRNIFKINNVVFVAFAHCHLFGK